MLIHQTLDFGAYGGGGSHCALWVLLFFFFKAGHAMDGFVRESCSPQAGKAHLSFIQNRLLKQEKEAEAALKQMALLGPTQLIKYRMAPAG